MLQKVLNQKNKQNRLRINLIIDQNPRLYLMNLLTKELMSELYDSVDYNNLKFEYVGPTKDVSL